MAFLFPLLDESEGPVVRVSDWDLRDPCSNVYSDMNVWMGGPGSRILSQCNPPHRVVIVSIK